MVSAPVDRYVRRVLAPLEPLTLNPDAVPADLNEAYGLVRDEVGEGRGFGAAWKLGGTTPTTRRIFRVEALYFGPLNESEILVEPTRAPGRPLAEIKGEAEIALRIAPSAAERLRSGPDAVRAAPLSDLFDTWCVALEMPASPIANLVDAGVAALVADRCAAGALLLGPVHAYGATTDWTGARLRIEQDGAVIAEGGSDSLVDPADICARDFLVEALRHGFRPAPGQWISTGGLTPCVGFRRDAEVVVTFDDRPVVRFTVGVE